MARLSGLMWTLEGGVGCRPRPERRLGMSSLTPASFSALPHALRGRISTAAVRVSQLPLCLEYAEPVDGHCSELGSVLRSPQRQASSEARSRIPCSNR